MYVILDIAWFRHAFPKSRFKLVSTKQIRKIIATGIKKVKVDMSKSEVIEASAASAAAPDANDDQARQSGQAGGLSQGSSESDEGKSVETPVGEGEQPAPDAVTPQEEGPEGSGIDTVTIDDKDEWESSGIDTVTIEEKDEWESSGIDTVTIEEKDEWESSGIDTVTIEEKDKGEGSGIDTVTVEEQDEPEGSGIDTVTVEEQDRGEGSGIDAVTLDDQDEPEGYLPPRMVKAEDLALGMYVILEAKPDSISLLEGSFRIATEDQLAELVSSGIGAVRVDPGRSDPDTLPPAELVPVEVIAAELRETLEDALIPPRNKAGAIYRYAIRMMEQLLVKPSAENIAQGKEMVRAIVDQIMADDEMANFMVVILPHDEHTYTHSANVGVLSILLAKAALKDSGDYDLVELGTGFFLHDLGMTQMPAQLLSKRGKLSAAEWKLIRRHPSSGEKMLAATNVWTEECARILLQHHEREDGSGYPQGLSGDGIDPAAQICRIADVYEALTSRRRYRAAPVLAPYQALQTMKASMVNDYNAEIFRVFVSLFSR